MDRSTPIIVNMQSGTAQKKFDSIANYVDKKYVFLAKQPTDFVKIYSKVLKIKPKTIILAGGDGTLIKGMDALLKKGYSGNFGFLPFGTANYLARDLGISLDSVEALKQIKDGKPKDLPLAKVNDDLFALMMTVGLTRRISANVEDSLKQRLGQMAYVLELFRQSAKHQPFTFEMEFDNGKRQIKGTTHQLMVYNADLNQQFKIVPSHHLKKRTLKVVVPSTGKSLVKLYMAFLLHIVSLGKVRRYLRVYEVKHAVITTKPIQGAGIDGEIIDKNSFEIIAADQVVSVIC